MAGQNKILWSLSLEGADDVSKKLKTAGDVGEDSAKRIKKAFSDVGTGSSPFGKFAQLAEGEHAAEQFRDRLRETLHVLHPILDEAGLGISNLGVFARLAGAGLGSLAAAIAGSVIVGLAKLGDEAARTKLHLNALGSSADTFDKLNEKAKKLGVSTSALVPGLEQYRAAVNKTDADLNRTVSHPPGFKGDENAPDVRIIGGGKETGARVPAETFLTAHSALIESGQSEKISGDEAAKQADAFEKKLLENRQLTSDAVRELSPSAANNLAHALEPVFGTSLKDGAALIAQLDRPGARLPSDNDTLRALAKAEPNIAKQAEAAKGVVAGFEAVAAASKRLAEKLAPDGTTIGRQLTGTANDIDKLASTTLQDEMKKALAEAFGAPGKTPNQQVKEGFDAFRKEQQQKPTGHDAAKPFEYIPPPKNEFEYIPPPGGTPIDRALDLKRSVQKASDAATSATPTVPKFNPDGSPNPYGGQPINRHDGYTNPVGQAPQNEAERRQQIIESAKVSAEAYENQKLFNQNIRDQNGGNNPSPDKNNYAPPVLGHYDPASQTFVANPKQPPRDPNAVPGAPYLTTFPGYDRRLIKEFQDKFGPSGNPPGVENPTGQGLNPGDAPLKKVYIGPEPEEEKRKRREEDQDVDGFAAGGHIRGVGTSTSDSIPAMLSDGEYVVKASAVSRIGVDKLDALNQGTAHFADGGDVTTATADDDPVKVPPPPTDFRGSVSVTYDPVTHGAYINGTLHVPGDPILNDPIVKRGIEQSKAGMKDTSSHKKYKSDFVGDYGEGLGFAGGGLVGSAPSPLARLREVISQHFADGGMVSLPPFDMGLPDLGSPALDVANGSALNPSGGSSSGMEHWGTIDLRSDHGDFKAATQRDTMRHLSDAAKRAKRLSTGTKPAWYGG